MQWRDIEKKLHTLEEAKDGFTLTRRGVITLSDGTKVFVKIGIDDQTSAWANKEVAVYEFLAEHNFISMPKLVAHNKDKTGFAIEALLPEAEWDWTNTWTYERLEATLLAMDALAAIAPAPDDRNFFAVKLISEESDGWRRLAASAAKQQVLLKKMRSKGHTSLADSLDIGAMAAQSAGYNFDYNCLVHNDVRSDNCAWNPHQKTAKLIDWNWTQLGDRGIDVNALLVHVCKSGYDVFETHKERLNADALHWLAGFWFNHASSPLLPGGGSGPDSLRSRQLESGVLAFKLCDRLRGL